MVQPPVDRVVYQWPRPVGRCTGLAKDTHHLNSSQGAAPGFSTDPVYPGLVAIRPGRAMMIYNQKGWKNFEVKKGPIFPISFWRMRSAAHQPRCSQPCWSGLHAGKTDHREVTCKLDAYPFWCSPTKPRRKRRNLPAARSTSGSLHDEGVCRLPDERPELEIMRRISNCSLTLPSTRCKASSR